ncbi:amino acid ABC transporter membrane protein 2 (PAAT family) [Haloactinopolyspora alba]|uniref:Amino acid ABC transporter membrane protein 2 (PAAT family) n=1 Tax=Haloactinopolyspora alba TaxID=648780 RepID=A0A2P8DV58_9ACTN|nr:amino acid ABC transporter permease [Haloactinopolyspora alba]PSL01084.1 amino acid ABC transporter membrane protein 2 (PAAT family) [Haloactinopolyspora alba]
MNSVMFDIPGPAARRRQLIGTIIGTLVVAAILGWVLWTLWSEEQITPDQWEPFGEPDIISALFEGLLATLRAAAVAIVLAVVFGAILASGRLSEHAWLRWPSIAIIEFFRAVPLLLLISFIFLGFGSTLGTFYSLVLGLMLYNGSVLAEIFRAGILAVPRGQTEAGYAIGLRKSQVMRQILAPQAVASMLPAIISQCVVALKDTALGFVIGASGIVNTGESIYISPLYNNPLAVGFVLAAVFIVINYSLSKLATWIEARQRREGRSVVHVNDTTTGPAAGGIH